MDLTRLPYHPKITVFLAIAGYYLIPSAPSTCFFLSPRQQYIASQRIRLEHKEHLKERTTLHHISRSIFNINSTICAFGYFMINIVVQSFTFFLPTILTDLHWTATKAQLLTVPPYVLACIWAILISYISDRIRKRGVFIMTHTVVAMIGYIILITEKHRAGVKYFAVFLAALGAFPLGPFFLSWGMNNAAGPTIRVVSAGYIIAIGTLGAILATWTYLPNDAPDFVQGHAICLGGLVVAFLLAAGGVAYCRWENRQRRLGCRNWRLEGLSEEKEARRVLGYRHPDFRYIE